LGIGGWLITLTVDFMAQSKAVDCCIKQMYS
jgi:hypothetical protein